MTVKLTNRIPSKPNNKLKEAAIIWDRFYQNITPFPYAFTPKDFANLKILIRKLETADLSFEDYLEGITSKWHLDNASIPLFNSHFNTLIRKTSKFPPTYDKKLYNSLNTQELQEYQQHLRKLGYKYVFNSGGSSWVKE